jgi:hypothetical protein
MSNKTFFSFKAFLKECNQKDVIKRLSIYLASSWILLQVLAITWEPLGLPKHSVVFLILGLLIGFPLFMLLIWKFHLGPLEKQDEEIDVLDENRDKKRGPFFKMYFWSFGLITTFCIVAVISVIQTNFGNTVTLPTIIKSNKIAVLKFGNNTGDETLDVVGKMSADWIIHGITENQVGQAISQEVIEDYESVLTTQMDPKNSEMIIKEYLKPSKIITGNYYLNDNELLFQCTISDGTNDNVIISFKQTICDADHPLKCIEDLKQTIIGYLATESKQKLNIQDYPPKFEAYQNVLNARVNRENDDVYLEFLNNAIDLDSTYFEPKLLKIGHFYNLEDFKKADSLRQAIIPSSAINKRQRNLLNFYEALLQGNNRKIYKTSKNEYDIAPFDMETNASMMVIALQFVYKPERIDSIYSAISMKGMDLENCINCQYRYYIKAVADIELKKYNQVVSAMQPVTKIINDYYLKTPLLVSYVRLGNHDALANILDKLKVTNTINEWAKANIDIAKEFLLLNNKSKAREYLNSVLTKKNNLTKNILANTFFYIEDYANAERLFKELIKTYPKNIEFMAKLLIISEKLNKSLETELYHQKLNDLRESYQYGAIDYALAQYYASKNDKEKTIVHLQKSIANGNRLNLFKFQHDFYFKDYINSQEFQELLRFWH